MLPNRCEIYARVSTDDQTTTNQIDELSRVSSAQDLSVCVGTVYKVLETV